jgi:MFS family permease
MIAGGMLLFGACVASLGVHQSLLAKVLFGLSDGAIALVFVSAMAVSVAAAVWMGVIADQRPRRRLTALLAVAANLAGALLVWVWPVPAAFVLAHGLLLSVGGTIFGQLFAAARLASAGHRPERRDGILAVLRALFALPFVIVPPLWGLAFGWGLPLLAIYPVVAALALLHLILVLVAWPADGRASWPEEPSGLGFRASLREIAQPAVLLRVALIGALHAGPALAGMLLGLAFAAAGRPPGHLGYFFGLFVALEIAATLALPRLLGRLGRLTVIGLGVGLYAGFLLLLAPLAGSPWLWALVLPAGIGGGLIFTLAIAYLQDLLGRRPGAGGSLLAVQRIAAEGLAIAAFAGGTAAVALAGGSALVGYAAAGALGALAILAAMAALLRLDGRPAV